MRPGPGLGIPTATAQSDLKFVLHIGHDEFPRIILSPGDAQESFYLTKLSLELAEKYQLPVLILIDKYISESDFSPELFESNHKNERFEILTQINNQPDKIFKRYQLNEKGVSPRPLPGKPGGIHCCNSYEHDEFGYGTEEGKMRTMMMDKRMKKLALIRNEIPTQPIFGPEKAKTRLISWGSNKGPILEMLKTEQNMAFLHLSWLWPFPKKQVSKFVQGAEKVICLECNATGQLASLIKEQTGIEVESLLKYDGRPFWPSKIAQFIAK